MTVPKRFIHAVVATLMMVALGGSAISPAAAQVGGDSYTDPAYDWNVSWDDDIWTTVDNPTYELVLSNEAESYVFFQNRDEWGDAQDCLDGRVDEVASEDGVDDLEPLEDEDGDPIGTNSNDRATATYSLTFTGSGRPIDRVNAFDCRVLVPGEAVLAVTYVTSADAYEDDVADVDDLLVDLTIPETTSADETPTGIADDADATETPDDEPTETATEEETSTPEDEDPTETPVDEATGTPDDDEPTATLDETAESDEAPDPNAGIDGNTYESPTYGFSVEWDEDVWTPNVDSRREADRDTLVLDLFELSGYVYVEAYEAYDGDPADCLAGASDELLDDPDVDDVEPYEDDDGDVVEGEDGGVAFAAYAFDFDGTAAAAYVECRTLVEDEAVLAVSLVTVDDDFEDGVGELADLLDTLDLGDADSTPTEEADETATPDEDETPTPDDDTAGVNGDSYTSPTYGYTVEWDEDLWEVDEERTRSGDRDVLVLDYTDGGSLFIEGYEDYDGDPEECLTGSSDEILDLDTVDNVDPLEDDDGDLVEGEADGVVFAAYSVEIENTPAVAYFSCQVLVEDEAVLAFSLIVPEDDATEGLEALADVQASLELAGRADQRRETATPEDDETPTPDDSAGVNGNVYESPSYGFTLEWDEDVWEVDEAASEDDVDLLVLTDGVSTVTFAAAEAFDGDAEECVAAAEDDIADRRGVEDVEILEDEDGPLVEGDEVYAYAYYGYTLEQRNGDTEEMYEYVECSTLDDGQSVLRISQAASIADADEELDALEELLDGVELASTGPVLLRPVTSVAA